MSSDPARILSALDPEQRQVAEALRGPVRVLAGAGTGKTRAITHRIAYGVASGVYAPTEVLAVTFTARAAGEMRTRLRDLGAGGVQARTFHAAALRQLRWFWPRVHGTELPELVTSKLSMVSTACRRQRLEADQALLKDLASEIEWAKVSNVSAETYAALAPGRGRQVSGADPATVARVLEAYEEVKRGLGRMDMEDILLYTAGLLSTEERVAAAVRSQYRFFTVDEFQDVSPLQSALLDLWLGGRDELCVVGDPAQTIYSFAGADADQLRNFTRKHPEATSVELVRNYRSTPQIVSAANRLLARTPSAGVELRAQRESGPEVVWQGHSDEVAEAEAVAAEMLTLHSAGVPWSQIAVLFRVNAQSETLEEALAARSIPYVVRGAARFFDRPEVRQAITLLRGAGRSGQLPEGEGVPAQVQSVLSTMGWSATAPSARGQTRDRWESLQALVGQAQQWAAEYPQAGLGDLVDELDRRAADQHAPVAEGVTLATLHTAKGLEWDAVFLVGVHEGAMPISYAESAAEIEEERRLLYVGLTRARTRLQVGWAAARNPGGRGNRKPSRFLTPVLPERLLAASTSSGPGSAKSSRKRVANCRECGRPLDTATERKVGRCGDCPASYDEELFERLRGWRKTRAELEKVPAYVIFTDATLQLVAELKPDSEQTLLKISGIGRTKWEKYGEELLRLVAGEDPERTE